MIKKEDLTVEVLDGGYMIKRNEMDWIKQVGYMPYPVKKKGKLDLMASAQMHIDKMLEDMQTSETEKTTQEARLENLEDAIMALMMK